MAAQKERLPGANPQYAEIAVDAVVGPNRTFTYHVPPSFIWNLATLCGFRYCLEKSPV